MVQDNQHRLNILRAFLDLITIVAAYFLTYLLFFHVFSPDSVFGGQIHVAMTGLDYVIPILFLAPLHLVVYFWSHLYQTMTITGRRVEAIKVFRSNLLCILIFGMFFWLFVKSEKMMVFSRMFLAEFLVIDTMGIVLQRNLLRKIIVRLRRQGYTKRTILLVGYSRASEALLDRIKINARWGYSVYGIVTNKKPVDYQYLDYKVVGNLEDLPKILEKNIVEEVFITLGLEDYEYLENMVHICEKAGVQTKFVPDYGSLMSAHPYTEDLMGVPVIYVRKVPLDDMFNAFVKRSMDIFGSLFAIILFSPIMLVTAIMIKATSKGPLIYKQERIGLHNKPFMMYKFRSMVVQDSEAEKSKWTTADDPRVTKVGKFIRKTSIDELPQLFNVLMGSMSMVGPRPERPQFVEKFKEEIPRYMIKHQVRPGMTGWAQVNGLRGDTSIEERINHDLYYIENWSLELDINILFLTFFKGFVNKNAY